MLPESTTDKLFDAAMSEADFMIDLPGFERIANKVIAIMFSNLL